MAKRQMEWARRKYTEMKEKLGGKCVKCGTTEDLEFDIIVPSGRPDHHRKYNLSQRVTFYRYQFEMNNLQLLCAKHNKEKDDKLVLNPSLSEPNPF